MARLRRVEITVGDDGSHSVEHRFHPEPVKRAGRMNGGMAMDYPKEEVHNFGPTPAERTRLEGHLREVLNLKGGTKGPERNDTRKRPDTGEVAPRQAAEAEETY